MEIGGVIMSLYGRHKASYSNSNGQTLAVSGEERGGVAAKASRPIQSGLFCRKLFLPIILSTSCLFSTPSPLLPLQPPTLLLLPGVAVPSPRW